MLSVVIAFYRTCVIDAVLDHSPAEFAQPIFAGRVPTLGFDAGGSLHGAQIAACHADLRTTMRRDRAGTNLDRHPNDILAYLAAGT